jgi:RimJ/RimL family protein N-acetyltransferase
MRVFLETERLLLRAFVESDIDNLVELNSDPEVLRFINGGKPMSRKELETDFLARYLQYHRETPDRGFFAAIEKSSGEFIGWFHLREKPTDAPDNMELGYRLRRSAWGRGYATEGSRALLAKGFTDCGANRVWAETMTVNLRSQHVMEKCGLRFVRTFLIDWPEEIEGSDQGDVEYAITRTEWQALTPEVQNR